MKSLTASLLALLFVGNLSAQEWTEEGEAPAQEQAAEEAATETPAVDPASLPGLEPVPAEAPEDAAAPKMEMPEMEEPAEDSEEASAPPADAVEEPTVEELATPEPPAPVAKKVVKHSAPLPASRAPYRDRGRQLAADSTYTVVKGDTLWDISGSFYSNPFLWPRIWEANKSIVANPDLIYPDQRFLIADAEALPAVETVPQPDLSAAADGVPEAAPAASDGDTAAAPEASADDAAAAEEAAAAESVPEGSSSPEAAEAPSASAEESSWAGASTTPAGKGTVRSVRGDYFIADADWEGDGQILSDTQKKYMISLYDEVILNVGKAQGVVPRARAVIYQKGQSVPDARTDDGTRGYIFKRVGVLEVTKDIAEQSCTAVIVSANDPILTGDLVKLISLP